MKSNERKYNMGNIRFWMTVILVAVYSTISQSCQLNPNRQATDTTDTDSQSTDIGEILTGCQENVIYSGLTLNQCDYKSEPLTVIDLTGEKSARKVHYFKNNP